LNAEIFCFSLQPCLQLAGSDTRVGKISHYRHGEYALHHSLIQIHDIHILLGRLIQDITDKSGPVFAQEGDDP
jgi:hypothetical protein